MIWEDALNPDQREAVKQIDGPVLILAGAGTGKTRTLTCRVAHMLKKGIQPDSILCLTFSNKAANEMRERVIGLIGSVRKKSARPYLSTFHSFGVKVLKESIHHLGYGRQFVIYDQPDQLGLIKRLITQFSGEDLPKDPPALLALVSKYRNWKIAPTGKLPDSWGPELDRVASRYESSLKAANALDFDDLLIRTLELFKQHPEVLQKYQEKFQYLMVDEYQDTNKIQLELLLLLAKHHQNICVVGDDDQSIYGWRGAEISNLLNLEDHFDNLKVIKLEQNYRSTNTILKSANALIKNNPRRRPKNLWSENGEGEPISLYSFENDEKEALAVVDKIESERILKGIPWKAQAILFRTNQQSRQFELALRKSKIAYVLIGGLSFFDRKEIRDTLAYLKVLINPNDDTSLLRIFNVPPRGVGATSVQKLLAMAEERSKPVWEVLNHTDVLGALQRKTAVSVERFYTIVETYREKLQESVGTPSPILFEFFDEIGFFEEVRKIEKDEESGEARERNVKDLIEQVDAFVPGNKKSHLDRLSSYLSDLTLDGSKFGDGDASDERDVVTLITMHSCKGLEFPYVYIAGCEHGILPHSRSLEEGSIDEERRLFYVACTRAQKHLSIGHCRGRLNRGKIMARHPSPFIKEIPEDLIERVDPTKSEPVTKEDSSKFFDSIRSMIDN